MPSAKAAKERPNARVNEERLTQERLKPKERRKEQVSTLLRVLPSWAMHTGGQLSICASAVSDAGAEGRRAEA